VIDPVVNELAAMHEFAKRVQQVLPVDEDAERLAVAAMRRHSASRPKRKLTRKIPSGG
jgi:hypothetical protein